MTIPTLATTVVTHGGRKTQPFRRRPSQRRAQMTFQAIQEACIKILEREGEAALNTNHISEVAGISVGTLYKYFPNKDAILESLCNDMLMMSLEHIDTMSDKFIDTARYSLEDTIRQMIGIEIGRHRELLRQFKSYYRDIHWKFVYEYYVTNNLPGRIHTRVWIEKLLNKYRDNLAVDDLSLAANMVTHIMTGTIHSAISSSPDMLSDDSLEQELGTAILRYLKPAARIKDTALVQGEPTETDGK